MTPAAQVKRSSCCFGGETEVEVEPDAEGAGQGECVGIRWAVGMDKRQEVDVLVTLRSLASRNGLEGQEAHGVTHSPGAPHDGADPGRRAGGARRGPSLHRPGPGR